MNALKSGHLWKNLKRATDSFLDCLWIRSPSVQRLPRRWSACQHFMDICFLLRWAWWPPSSRKVQRSANFSMGLKAGCHGSKGKAVVTQVRTGCHCLPQKGLSAQNGISIISWAQLLSLIKGINARIQVSAQLVQIPKTSKSSHCMAGLGKNKSQDPSHSEQASCHTCVMVHGGPSILQPLCHVLGWKFYNDYSAGPNPARHLLPFCPHVSFPSSFLSLGKDY